MKALALTAALMLCALAVGCSPGLLVSQSNFDKKMRCHALDGQLRNNLRTFDTLESLQYSPKFDTCIVVYSADMTSIGGGFLIEAKDALGPKMYESKSWSMSNPVAHANVITERDNYVKMLNAKYGE